VRFENRCASLRRAFRVHHSITHSPTHVLGVSSIRAGSSRAEAIREHGVGVGVDVDIGVVDDAKRRRRRRLRSLCSELSNALHHLVVLQHHVTNTVPLSPLPTYSSSSSSLSTFVIFERSYFSYFLTHTFFYRAIEVSLSQALILIIGSLQVSLKLDLVGLPTIHRSLSGFPDISGEPIHPRLRGRVNFQG